MTRCASLVLVVLLGCHSGPEPTGDEQRRSSLEPKGDEQHRSSTEPKPAKPWCYDKPNVKPAAWVCADSELACYKSLAQTRFDMRFPHGQDGKDAWSPADPFAIFCIEKTW